jgi:hypothetical protein
VKNKTHPAGRNVVARADSDAVWAWADTEREALRVAVWRRRFWAAVTIGVWGANVAVWAFALSILWSVTR